MHFLFGFSGRIGRGQWWLGQLIGMVVLGFGMSLVGRMNFDDPGLGPRSLTPILLAVASILALVWINFAVTVKRFHDRNKPWPYVFVVFVPLIGGFWQVVECGFLPGTPGRNDYGDPPGRSTLPSSGLSGRSPSDSDDQRRDEAIIERWTTMVTVKETAAPASRRATSGSAPSPLPSTGPTAFGRRGR